jgi:hypothetical protein
MATMAVAFSMASNAGVQQARNLAGIQQAQLQTESGLSFLTYLLRHGVVRTGTRGQDLLDAAANALGTALNGTATLGGGSVLYDGNTIVVPPIVTGGAGEVFSATLALDGNDAVCLLVTGTSRGVTRRASIDVKLIDGTSGIFDFGVASKGKISMTGNAQVEGANNPAEANVLAATFADQEAVSLTGNCSIQGDVSISNPDGYASLTGNVSIGGHSASSPEVLDHIHVGTGQVDFPEVDPNVFEPYATNIVDASTSTSGNKTFENIRIKANTNKTFSGNITLKGVVFIETPNQIHFSGNLNMTGVLVTQDAGEGNYQSNTIKFSGNTTVRGVEQLPDEPQFAQLKELPGAFLLAPGFGVEFVGNFGTVSGCMAADQFKFTGNAGGTVKGGIINYGDTDLTLVGNSHLIIDRSGTPQRPAGFNLPARFSVLGDSYREY